MQYFNRSTLRQKKSMLYKTSKILIKAVSITWGRGMGKHKNIDPVFN